MLATRRSATRGSATKGKSRLRNPPQECGFCRATTEDGAMKMPAMQKVRSADGTHIAFEKLGQGPCVVLVGGAFCDHRARVSGLPLARALAPAMTALCYDRRGRGESEDTPPYAVAREVEDLAAVLAACEGPAHVYGHSSGAIL